MGRYVIKRLIQMLPMLLLISFIAFGATKLAPGDFLSAKAMDPTVSKESIERERQRLGLDKPWYVQYVIWVGNIARLDLGESFLYKIPVSHLIAQRVGNTLLLGLVILLFTWLVGIPLGIYVGVHQYSWPDKVVTTLAYIIYGIPDFFFSILLLLFAANTGWFPIGGMTSGDFETMGLLHQIGDVAWHLVLPTIAVGLGSLAYLQRRMRGNLLDVLAEDYVRMARAKGLPENKVIYKHAVRNAINPLVTILGFEIAGLLSGVGLVEIVFSWPGMGTMMLDALQQLDLNVSMAGLVMGATMLLVGNLLADILLALVDPRIRLEA